MKKIQIIAVICAAFIGLQCKDSNPTSSTDTTTTSGSSSATVPTVFSKFISDVEISVDGNSVVIEAKGVPNHTSPYWGTGHALYEAPHTGMVINPNAISEQTLTFRIPLNPAVASSVTATSLGPVGVSVNGVALYNQYAGPSQPLTNEIISFDRLNGHPQNSGQYHYHVEPLHLTNNGSDLIGFLLDGFPVYGQKDQDGTIPTNLDAANGHTTATADYPDGIYHYHIILADPYISDGFKGTPGTVTQ